ncbi:hypothetical protein [Nostoc sp. MS1]|uniref:hypothetical protein n=1 Tax=Nostoc sp. MS1 TaxID=2764711 RepID=UPI001CC3623C|nr:hypothetical protein [Nostoc sp. MS1]
MLSITACNHSANSQTSFANHPSVANSSVESNSTSPPVSATQNPTDTNSLQQQAVQVIHEYYNAIAAQDYQKAYLIWDGNGSASKQSFEQFKQGFADTASVAEEIGKPSQIQGGAGS